jgi:hypothetical protein
MSKITFKRIALVVVATLGLGVLSTGPSSGAFTANSDTLTASATAATIAAGETASVTISASAVANTLADSLNVTVLTQSRPASGDGSLGFYVTESSTTSVAIRTSAQAQSTGTASATDLQSDFYGAAGVSIPDSVTISAGLTATAATAFSFSARLSFMAPTVEGTYVFRITNSHAQGSVSINATPLTWTVTVTANASDTGTSASKFWMNRTTEYVAWHASTGGGTQKTVTANDYRTLEVDSALVVSAGTVGTYTAHAVIAPVIMNSSDTKISTRTGSRVLESMTITVSGPGQLSVASRYTGALVAAATRTYSKQVTIAYDETAVVFSDGTAGTATITGYIGSASTSNKALTQGTKSIVWVGRATTFTVTGYSAAIRGGSTVAYTGAADSATAAATAFRFTAADAAGNAVTEATLNTDKGEAAFYAISSDTSVLASGEVGATYATSGARRSPALACSYDSTSSVKGYWYCTGRVYDSGVVTVTIVDSRTMTASGNVTTATTDAVAKSTAFSITYAGNGYTGTIALDKSAYKVSEAATLTLTCKDSGGRNVADGNNTGCFTNLKWTGAAPTFSVNSTVNAAGGTFTDMLTYLDGSGSVALNETSYLLGSDTALVYMPTLAGTYTLMGRTSGATTDATLLTFTVSDPVQDAQNAAIAASQAAADAATDAALEAIDAANAATDAANLAAEAADAATVAAEEARDAADAATAAVEALATEVATLMAALKAQITTLAKTIAKIAKKVKA